MKRRVETESERRVIWVVIATIPGALAGYLLQDYAKSVFRSPMLIGTMLIVMGLILWLVDRGARQDRALATMTWLDAALIGLPAPLLLALIAALAEVIPIVGPFIGAVPAVLIATTVSPQTALITMGVYLLLQIIEGNVLVPIVMRNSVGLSPFLVLVSLLIGSAAGGVLGAVVSVPIVAAITVVLHRLQDREIPVHIDPAAAEETDGTKDASRDPGAARAAPGPA